MRGGWSRIPKDCCSVGRGPRPLRTSRGSSSRGSERFETRPGSSRAPHGEHAARFFRVSFGSSPHLKGTWSSVGDLPRRAGVRFSEPPRGGRACDSLRGDRRGRGDRTARERQPRTPQRGAATESRGPVEPASYDARILWVCSLCSIGWIAPG